MIENMCNHGMQDKTIKKILNWKLNNWADSLPVSNSERKLILENTIVTGGSIASMMLGEKINDFDVYFKNSSIANTLANIYVKQFVANHSDMYSMNDVNIYEEPNRVRIVVKSYGIFDNANDDVNYESKKNSDDDDDGNMPNGKKYVVQFISENAITLSGSVQLIMRFCGSPEEVHKSFDYVHATCWYEYANNSLNYSTEALRSLQTKRLIYRGSLFPICSLFRMRKFIQRGWTISAGEVLKMAIQVSELDLSDPNVLREQLTGVDAIYFNMLIQIIEEQKHQFMSKNTGEIEIPASYIIDVINKIFEE